MNASEHVLKVATLSGYRSAIKDIYRQKKMDLSVLFAGLKRIEAKRNQLRTGEAMMTGKMALPYSTLNTVTLLWNLMCRAQSVESINPGHISNQNDSIGIVFHMSKVNQDAVYWACCPRQGPGWLFPGLSQRNRHRKVFSPALEG
ncbi:hypothetical protein PHMEG_00021169 [Phytophthora megakarya]|uniref:Uncharacterized protein n=1 Tax=Phytophthora megakarya TaxID=4795 RepID=A0A225VP81_9STRA|nr:hypothetical protein PHMEG_00021169 [Phytophthora megakarya]